jgi:hypothetical protein
MSGIIGITVGTTLSASSVANSLKGTASGATVSMKDVSPLEHNIKVKLSAETTVSPLANAYLEYENGHGDFAVTDIHYEEVYGGDVAVLEGGAVLCFESGLFDQRIKVGSIIRYDESGLFLVAEMDYSTVTLKKYGKNLVDYRTAYPRMSGNTITFDEGIDGLYWNGTYYFVIPVSVPAGTTIRFSCNMESVDPSYDSRYNRWDIVYTDGTTQFVGDELNGEGFFTLKKDLAYIRPHKSNLDDRNQVKVTNIQLEIGTTATEYEPYKEEAYTPNADGTVDGVTSLYPITTIMTDTAGVTITAEYNRDINKAFAEILAKIEG